MKKCEHRSKAKDLSQKKYNTGKPCKQGHLSDRFTSNGNCIACQTKRTKTSQSLKYQSDYQKKYYNTEEKKAKRNAYHREYYANKLSRVLDKK